MQLLRLKQYIHMKDKLHTYYKITLVMNSWTLDLELIRSASTAGLVALVIETLTLTSRKEG